MVRLIENTVKGLLQIPSGSENKLSVDLLRRILVSNPKQRYGIKEIMEHPWFQVKVSWIKCRNITSVL
jgi:serine/threonine protein kinase